MSELADFVRRYADVRIAVVGDLMLDRYIWGRAHRISQEAPVPVVSVDRETEVPGGAANVVRNITSLGGQALTVGTVGEDRAGDALLELLRRGGACVDTVIRCRDRLTTVKERVVAAGQQVVRIDKEKTGPLDDYTRRIMLDGLLDIIRSGDVDAVIFEDYAKGVLSRELIQTATDEARRTGVKTALDPHPGDPFNVNGLTLMTPNRVEAFGLAGRYYRPTVLPLQEDKALLDVGNQLRRQWQTDYLLVTMGGDGMALFLAEQSPVHIPTRAREVFDVSGAGDTVTASFLLSLVAGASPVEAAQLANHAAGIVVAKVGTVPVQAHELVESIHDDHGEVRQ